MQLLDSFVVEIVRFLQELVRPDTGLSFDTIFIFALVLELVVLGFFILKSMFSYEVRMTRSLVKLNRWLFMNKKIDETNLVAFNNQIRTAPKLLRHHWQQYMLYREGLPSTYMSTGNLLDKPLQTSSYKSNIKNYTLVSTILIGFMFIVSLAVYSAASTTLTITALLGSTIIPIAMLVFHMVFIMALNSRRSANMNELYRNYHLFARFVDKASATLPDYVDYEVLFTKEEITKGLPVLNEFLEKRAIREKMEFEKAKRNAIEHEKYDFAEAGMDGELMLERAMKETEYYLNIRNRVMTEVQQIDAEIENKKKNYEEAQKEFSRKMQASKENVERLRKELEETSNRIETNYIKKQQSDEIKKQEQLEKDFDNLTRKHTQDLVTLEKEIEVKKADLDEKRKYVETAMFAEYQTFSSKLYDSVSEVAEKNIFSDRDLLLSQKAALESRVEQLMSKLKEVRGDAAEEGEYDDNGNYVYPSGAYYDKNGIYHDEFGGFYDKDGTYYSETRTSAPISGEKKKNLQSNFGIGEKPMKPAPAPVKKPKEAEVKPVRTLSDVEPEGYKTLDEVEPEVVKVPANAKEEAVFDFDDEESVFSFDDEESEPVQKKTASQPMPIEVEYDEEPQVKKTVVREAAPAVAKKKAGRPKKDPATIVPKAPGKRGRPKKPEPLEPKVPGKRGRPRKNFDDLELINRQIIEENKKLNAQKQELNSAIDETLHKVEKAQGHTVEREEELSKLAAQADELMKHADRLKAEDADSAEIDRVNKEIQELLEKLNAYRNE